MPYLSLISRNMSKPYFLSCQSQLVKMPIHKWQTQSLTMMSTHWIVGDSKNQKCEQQTREVLSLTTSSVVPCETVAQPKESNVSPLSVQKTQTGERQRRSVIVCTAQSSLVYPGMTQCSQPTSLYPVSAQSFLHTLFYPHCTTSQSSMWVLRASK